MSTAQSTPRRTRGPRSARTGGQETFRMVFAGILLRAPGGWCLQRGFRGAKPICSVCGTGIEADASACDSCGAALAG